MSFDAAKLTFCSCLNDNQFIFSRLLQIFGGKITMETALESDFIIEIPLKMSQKVKNIVEMQKKQGSNETKEDKNSINNINVNINVN